MIRNPFQIHRTAVTENAPIKAGCLWYFGIGTYRDQYQVSIRYFGVIDLHSYL